jgi:hypothetical protein
MGVKNWEERPPVNRILPATLQEKQFLQQSPAPEYKQPRKLGKKLN